MERRLAEPVSGFSHPKNTCKNISAISKDSKYCWNFLYSPYNSMPVCWLSPCIWLKRPWRKLNHAWILGVSSSENSYSIGRETSFTNSHEEAGDPGLARLTAVQNLPEMASFWESVYPPRPYRWVLLDSLGMYPDIVGDMKHRYETATLAGAEYVLGKLVSVRMRKWGFLSEEGALCTSLDK